MVQIAYRCLFHRSQVSVLQECVADNIIIINPFQMCQELSNQLPFSHYSLWVLAWSPISLCASAPQDLSLPHFYTLFA